MCFFDWLNEWWIDSWILNYDIRRLDIFMALLYHYVRVHQEWISPNLYFKEVLTQVFWDLRRKPKMFGLLINSCHGLHFTDYKSNSKDKFFLKWLPLFTLADVLKACTSNRIASVLEKKRKQILELNVYLFFKYIQ